MRLAHVAVALLISLWALWGCQSPSSPSTPVASATTYTVTYFANGATSGVVPIDVHTYTDGSSATVLDNTGILGRPGYLFIGWNTKADGTGTSCLAASQVKISGANLVLFAHWAMTFTVTYAGNGSTSGSVPVDSNLYTQGATVTALANTGGLAKTAYTFVGWNTASNGTGTSLLVGSTFVMGASNVTLYAQWSNAPTYTILYSNGGATGGNVPVNPNNYLAGTTVTVAGNPGSLVKAGYVLTGWNTQSNGLGTAYSFDGTFTIGSASVVLYPVWTPTFTVTYSGNGASNGSVPVDSYNYFSGATVTVIGNTGTLTRANYVFAGWNTISGGEGSS